jgi:chromosome segregation ATPase
VTIEQGLAIVLAAIITAVVTTLASRRSAKNERIRMSQEMVTILGTERQKLADDLERVKTEARELAKERDQTQQELRKVREEYSLARIEHHNAVAEKDDAIREKNATIRELTAQCQEFKSQMHVAQTKNEELSDELNRARRDRSEALELINRQARLLANGPDRGVILKTDPDLIRPPHNQD